MAVPSRTVLVPRGQVGERHRSARAGPCPGRRDPAVLRVGVAAGVLARRAPRARPPRSCRCRAPPPRWRGRRAGRGWSSGWPSGPRGRTCNAPAPVRRCPAGRSRRCRPLARPAGTGSRLAGAHRQRAEELLADEIDGPVGVEVGSEAPRPRRRRRRAPPGAASCRGRSQERPAHRRRAGCRRGRPGSPWRGGRTPGSRRCVPAGPHQRRAGARSRWQPRRCRRRCPSCRSYMDSRHARSSSSRLAK